MCAGLHADEALPFLRRGVGCREVFLAHIERRDRYVGQVRRSDGQPRPVLDLVAASDHAYRRAAHDRGVAEVLLQQLRDRVVAVGVVCGDEDEDQVCRTPLQAVRGAGAGLLRSFRDRGRV